ncbi:SPARC-related modular calcium-binding protein 1 [Mactra antiquata]
MRTFVCLAVLIASTVGQHFNGGHSSWYCTTLGNEDCSTHELDERCGTDGRTYRNMCAMGQAHCADHSIDQQHTGACVTITTTKSPQEVVHGSAIVLDFQCVMLSHRDCYDTVNEKICGTDGRTYPTFCEYEKARCTHRDLHVAHLGDCSV